MRVSCLASYVFELEMKGKVNEVPVNGRERVTLPSHRVLKIFKGAKPVTQSVQAIVIE